MYMVAASSTTVGPPALTEARRQWACYEAEQVRAMSLGEAESVAVIPSSPSEGIGGCVSSGGISDAVDVKNGLGSSAERPRCPS
ncbi:hypothetical protein P3T76_002210 [Phytophthora citrophthora]|uniref:Uncharacterized protein n=1 Tax=Phytophthora citrophthora TaxID=4793 RepID=A0AAD9LRA7_9STRA|nr:hypothetical protein P3T76_002210 [Phytophthora citrophthora]